MDKFEDIKDKINIKDIKSFYIIKKIFSFLFENYTLNIISYNKELQEILLFNIENYKSISHRYVLGEKNGKGKEYMRKINKLLFEGEYINGKRNGKGKEYDYYGKLLFEGEYLNGKRNGKGKEYYDDGNILFEGELLKGKQWNGKGYNKNGNIILEIKNGNGKGKEYYYTISEFKYLKENIYMEKKMEKQKNIMIMGNWNLKENI